ncbi:MAG: hypothetical protein ACRDPF_17970 [Streptosporangiaceae bacterium]
MQHDDHARAVRVGPLPPGGGFRRVQVREQERPGQLGVADAPQAGKEIWNCR